MAARKAAGTPLQPFHTLGLADGHLAGFSPFLHILSRHALFVPRPPFIFTRKFCNFVTLPLFGERKRLKNLINKGLSEDFPRVTKTRYKLVTKYFGLLQNGGFCIRFRACWSSQYRLRYKNFGPLFTESKFVTYSLRIQSY